MKTMYDAPLFSFVESIRSSDRVITFEEILSCLVDEDEYYRRVKGEGLTSILDLVALGLVLAGQPFGPFEVPAAPELPIMDPRPKDPPVEEPRGDAKKTLPGKKSRRLMLPSLFRPLMKFSLTLILTCLKLVL